MFERRRWLALVSPWLNFWFSPFSLAQLALMRIGVGLIALYLLFVTSFDLDVHFGPGGWADSGAVRALDPFAWPYSALNWFGTPFWTWAVHLLAILVTLAFMAGVHPFWNGAAWLFLAFSYAHRNPGVVTGLDTLLWLAVFYLALTPCGRMFGAMDDTEFGRQGYRTAPDSGGGPHWEGFAVRMLQVHVAILYFQGGLEKLNPEWLAGSAFWNPRLVETGLPAGQGLLRAVPQGSAVFIYGAILFQLFFPVLVWLRQFRYPMLGLAVVFHAAVAALWGKAPQHLLMLVLLLAFVRPPHLERFIEWVFEQLNWPPPRRRGGV
jgi:hypothetical protein